MFIGYKRILENSMLLSRETIAYISLMKAVGNQLFLPHFFMANYGEVRDTMIVAGGTLQGDHFVFDEPASKIKKRFLSGEPINDRRAYQCADSPKVVHETLLSKAKLKAGMRVLEPSAGKGELLGAIMAQEPDLRLDAIDIMKINTDTINEKYGFSLTPVDFLQFTPKPDLLYDRIIACPPFLHGLDVDHIYKMFSCLKDDGLLTSVASASWIKGKNASHIKFKVWLRKQKGEVTPLPSGIFPHTNQKAVVVTIDKRKMLKKKKGVSA